MRYLAVIALALSAFACATGRRGLDASVYLPRIWPTANGACTVASSFGYRDDPISGQRRFHSGIDLAAPRKSRVVATAYGTVCYAGRDRGGYGKHVIVDHGNGYQTVYAHLSRIKVKRGRFVKRGEVIGKAGKTGRVTRPHLHYEVRRHGKPVDPRAYLAE